MTIKERLLELQDLKYKEFQKGLVPGISENAVIGVRVPQVRALAKTLLKEDKEIVNSFLRTLPHDTYDENMLHGVMLSELKDFDECVKLVEAFLPYVDNWAVCDIMSPKIFKKHKTDLLPYIEKWIASDQSYTIRFGMEMLMTHFLDEDFKEEYLNLVADVVNEEYYVRMMQAWFMATALAKQWDATIPFVEGNRMESWTHNKTIQKARESYRITAEQKEYLKGLKR